MPATKGKSVAASSRAAATTRKPSFLRLEPIIDIVRTAIWTGKVADEKPVSLMLVAEQESAKTECLKYFRGTSSLIYLADLTSRGLSVYKNEIESGVLRHICIMDLIRVVNHGKGVSNRTIQTLSSLMEEGESDSSDAGGNTKWEGFPTVGLLTAITPQFYNKKKGGWRDSGFLSRFLPIRFNYKPESANEIHDAISGGHKLPEPCPIQFHFENKKEKVSVLLADSEAKMISQRAKALGKTNGTYGFRYHRAIRSLAKASALMEKRPRVKERDVLKVLSWSDFFTDKVVEL
jgi:hypothetical protein